MKRLLFLTIIVMGGQNSMYAGKNKKTTPKCQPRKTNEKQQSTKLKHQAPPQGFRAKKGQEGQAGSLKSSGINNPYDLLNNND